jgi:hypothetical protein
MKTISIDEASVCLRQLAVAVAACGAVASPAAIAKPLSGLILVPRQNFLI